MMENKSIAEIKKQCAKYGMSPIELSMHIGVIPARIYEIMRGKRRITVDTDLRLCKFFQLKNRHFLDMQIEYDIEVVESKLKDSLHNIRSVDQVVTRKKD